MPAAGVRVSHVAVAVSDLEASTRFYTEGFGFERGPTFESSDEVAAVSEVQAPVRMRSSQTRNQRGLTHLSFEVDDIAATEGRLLELGGASLPDARVLIDKGPVPISIVFLADPDGTRIELLQRHSDPA
jgi:lactoylglutathione lyase